MDNYHNNIHYLVNRDPVYNIRYYYEDAKKYFTNVIGDFLKSVYRTYTSGGLPNRLRLDRRHMVPNNDLYG